MFENTNIIELCGTYSYLDRPSNISSLRITSGSLNSICFDTVNQILKRSSVENLNISNNNMSEIPKALATPGNRILRIWLKGNPVKCNCGMTWLIDWLDNDGQRVVQDYQDVTCLQGRQIGQPIYMVKPLDMGCFPQNHNLLITMGVLGGVVSFLMLALIPIIRKTDVRWLIYRKFGKLVGDPDKNEDIDAMVFDAFVSFRCETVKLILLPSGIGHS